MNLSTTLRFDTLTLASKLSWFAVALATVHFLTVVVVQSRPVVPLSSGLLQFATACLASICCFRASWRATGHSRSLWFLAGSTFAFWSAGQALDLINEFYLGNTDTNPTALLFVFFVAVAPLAFGTFHFTRRHFETAWIGFLDGAQVLGVLLAGFLLIHFVGDADGAARAADSRLQILHIRNLVLSAALVVRSLIARSYESRRLYAAMALTFSFYTLSSWLGNHALELWGVPTGSWSDLTWSVPFAIVAMTAAEWKVSKDPDEPVALGPHTRCATHLLTDYVLPVLLPVSVIALAYSKIQQEPFLASVLIVTSFSCFVARLCVTQFHRERLIRDLKETLKKVRLLSGLLPICAGCKMIRDGVGHWHNLESYIRSNSEADFTHGICPGCAQRLYPEHFHVLGG